MAILNISASSKIGCVRANNEDMLLVGETTIRNSKHLQTVDTAHAGRYLMALADGMGGHNGGEVASEDTLQNLKFFFSDMPAGMDACAFNETICEWLKSINFLIAAKGRENEQCKGMGTTLVALAYYEGAYYWMNCGDSRLYHWHDGHLQQLTTDHSLNNLLGKAEHSNIITNCIGGGCKTSYIDIKECTQLAQPDDAFILCSDGLSDMINDARINQLLTEGCDADDLCQAAEDAGGFDNVSVIIIRIHNS